MESNHLISKKQHGICSTQKLYDKSFVVYGRLDELHWKWTPNWHHIYRFCESVRPRSTLTSVAENQKFGNRWDYLQVDKSVFKRENPTSSSRPGGFHLDTSKMRYTSGIGFGGNCICNFYKWHVRRCRQHVSVICRCCQIIQKYYFQGRQHEATRWPGWDKWMVHTMAPFFDIDKCKSLHIDRKKCGIAIKWKERN